MSVTREQLQLTYERAEGWLANQPVQTLLALSDRLLVRALQDRHGAGGERAEADYQAQLALAQTFAARATELDIAAQIGQQLTSALIVLWALKRENRDPGRLEPVLASWIKHPIFQAGARQWQEPYRSAFYYWAVRVGMVEPRAPTEAPDHPLYQIYHHLHLVFYRTNYGEAPVAREVLEPHLEVVRQGLQSPTLFDDGDIVAEALLAELAVMPGNQGERKRLARQLVALQRHDGSFIATNEKQADARHHTGCVGMFVLAKMLALESAPADHARPH